VRKSCNKGEQAACVLARFWRGIDGGAGLKVRDVRGPHGGRGEVEGEERRGRL